MYGERLDNGSIRYFWNPFQAPLAFENSLDKAACVIFYKPTSFMYPLSLLMNPLLTLSVYNNLGLLPTTFVCSLVAYDIRVMNMYRQAAVLRLIALTDIFKGISLGAVLREIELTLQVNLFIYSQRPLVSPVLFI